MIRSESRRPLLEDYLIRLELALAAIGKEPLAEIVTSRDPRLAGQASALSALADEVRGWTPPFSGDEEMQTCVTITGPGGDIGPTLHLDGDAVRFILSGSTWFGGVELTPGDWMFIPAGCAYRLRVGHRGVISLSAIYRPEIALPRLDLPKESLLQWVE